MSVLIEGMDMPTSCAKCKLFGESGCPFIGAVGYALTRGERNEDCPLVPVPPHGRLIDADAMEKLMSDTVQGDIRQYPYSDTLWETAFDWIDHQPTVIKADKAINVLYKEEGE